MLSSRDEGLVYVNVERISPKHLQRRWTNKKDFVKETGRETREATIL